MKTIKFLFAFALLSVAFTSCSNDDDNPELVNEEEVITTLNVTFVPVGGGETVMFSFRDLDADGPNEPSITAPNLAGNTTYNATIEVLNETENPVEDITLEVMEEAEEHQFIFGIQGSIQSVTPTDEDVNGNPVGVTFDLVTNTAGSATLDIVLRHEPTKPNDGTLNGAGGETDIDASFTFNIN